MNKLMKSFTKRVIKTGSLEMVDGKGIVHTYGDGSGRKVRVRFADKATERAVILNPELKVGECFMDGKLIVEEGTIYDFIELVLTNLNEDDRRGGRAGWMNLIAGLRYLTRRIRQHNSLSRSRKNVAHHYDLDGRLYDLFLDSDKQYSCAYFESPDADLEDAQLAKKRHLAAKLCLEPGMEVLDIGSGWGGLGLYLSQLAEVDVTGVTLSEEQFEVSNARAAEKGLSDHARFHLRDYRTLDGPFDRIVSVGMFEHVGVGYYQEYFDKCRDLMAPDGSMVLHSIGRFDGPNETNSWVQKYIFPGGYIPALSEVIPAIEKAGLCITDIEILRLHYAETLKAWRERFMARRDEARDLFDERFCRMWEFYLASSESAFRHQGLMVFQIQISRDQQAVPLTRDYIHREEQKYRMREERLAPMRLAGE